MLSQLSLTEGEPQDGKTVVRALLKRCVLWIEIMREKYAPLHARPEHSLSIGTQTRQD